MHILPAGAISNHTETEYHAMAQVARSAVSNPWQSMYIVQENIVLQGGGIAKIGVDDELLPFPFHDGYLLTTADAVKNYAAALAVFDR